MVYVSKPGEKDLSLGDYLVEMTNELETGKHIIEFVSGGPKNYPNKTNKGNETCKVRGFTLNFTNSQLINFESVKTMTPQRYLSLLSPILIKYVVIREKENCIIKKKRKTMELCSQKINTGQL